MNICDLISPQNPWLAPLAGFSDLPFRLLCRLNGCGVACTEMVSAKGLVYNSAGTKELLATCPEDSPLVVQLFGLEPDFMEKAMRLFPEDTIFDLNCGCSVRKVVKTGSGAALLQDPGALEVLVRRMVQVAGVGKVGVKIRSGWSSQSPVFLEVGKRLEQAGAAWITLHPRYAKQAFSGVPQYEHLTELKKMVNIPILASGDLFRAEDAVRCLAQTGVDGVMFARGALADPAIFARFKILLQGGDAPKRELLDIQKLMLDLVRLYQMHNASLTPPAKLRTMLPRFVKEFPGAREMRRKLMTCVAWEELYTLIESLPKNGENNET